MREISAKEVMDKEGLIIKNISNHYLVLLNKKYYDCIPRGKFKHLNLTPMVGDKVIIDSDNNYILEIKKRKNYLLRPPVANIDIALIVTALKEPNISYYLLDKEISLALLNNIEPVILFTKKDLLNNDELLKIKKIKSYYETIGYKVYFNDELTKIKTYLKNKICVLTGQTGAGKSSFINRLGDLNIRTQEISKALGRGKTTTTHSELYQIDEISFIDTPGFSSLLLDKYNKEDIKNTFVEFKKYSCKYMDCYHEKEPDCGVKMALNDNKILPSRYDNYLRIKEELK